MKKIILCTFLVFFFNGILFISHDVFAARRSTFFDNKVENTKEEVKDKKDEKVEEQKEEKVIQSKLVPIKESTGKKDIKKALLFSALLPGAGQFYVENNKRPYFWGLIEAGLWSGFFIAGKMIVSKEDDYKVYAKVYGGSAYKGDDDYYGYMAKYASAEEYNNVVETAARNNYVYQSEAYTNYCLENKIKEERMWDWRENPDKWSKFQDLRYDRNQWDRRKRYLISAVLLNHLFSAIDASRQAYLHNKNMDKIFGNIELKMNYVVEENGLVPYVVLKKTF